MPGRRLIPRHFLALSKGKIWEPALSTGPCTGGAMMEGIVPPEYSYRFATKAATNRTRKVRDTLEETYSSLILFGRSSKAERY